MIPVTYFFNEEEDTIDVGGLNFASGKKWRDTQENPKVAFLVDDVIGPPRRARAVEIRGNAELHETGGETINPRFPNFAPAVHPDPPDAYRQLGVGRGTQPRPPRPRAVSITTPAIVG